MPSLQSRLVSALLRSTVKLGSRTPVALPVPLVRLAIEAPARLTRWAVRVRRKPIAHPKLRGEWLHPRSGTREGAVLYLHGGGYFFGSSLTHRPLTARLAGKCRLPVLSLDYRLAPEHPHPAALEDAHAAWRHLRDSGLPASRIAVAGDSAGGGLALALMLLLRDLGEELPAAAVCFSPWTDLVGTGPSLDHNDTHCAMFHGRALPRAARHYVGDGDPRHPLISPLYGDLRGLPPLLIHVSGSEVLLDDSTRLARRAQEAGVPVSLRIWQGMPHVWQIFAPVVPEARASLREAASFLRRELGLEPSR